MIKVCLMKRENRKFYECQWADLVTGRLRTKTTKCLSLRDAERFRAKLERMLNDGESVDGNTTWADATARYRAEILPLLRPKSRLKIESTIRLVERVIDPKRVSGINETQIAKIRSDLNEKGRSILTLVNHLTNLRSFLKWSHLERLTPRVPAIKMPKRPSEKMRGRAITGDELDRMIAAIPKVVDAAHDSWGFFIRGLYMSGLRLSEALALHWTDNTEISIELGGKRPMFRVQGSADKAGKFRLLPMAPEFFEMLETIPDDDRTGFVFSPISKNRGRGVRRNPPVYCRPTANDASKIIVSIGKAAGVKAHTNGNGGTKWASAHDLRRSFGNRWSDRVPPKILQQLMRHGAIQTTMQYYVMQDSEAAADRLWDFASPTNTIANSLPDDASETLKNK